MVAEIEGISRTELTRVIDKLIDNLVNIKDPNGEFLLRLDDGRVIELQAHVESRYAVVGKVNDKACGTQSFLQVLGELLLIFDNQ